MYAGSGMQAGWDDWDSWEVEQSVSVAMVGMPTDGEQVLYLEKCRRLMSLEYVERGQGRVHAGE